MDTSKKLKNNPAIKELRKRPSDTLVEKSRVFSFFHPLEHTSKKVDAIQPTTFEEYAEKTLLQLLHKYNGANGKPHFEAYNEAVEELQGYVEGLGFVLTGNDSNALPKFSSHLTNIGEQDASRIASAAEKALEATLKSKESSFSQIRLAMKNSQIAKLTKASNINLINTGRDLRYMHSSVGHAAVSTLYGAKKRLPGSIANTVRGNSYVTQFGESYQNSMPDHLKNPLCDVDLRVDKAYEPEPYRFVHLTLEALLKLEELLQKVSQAWSSLSDNITKYITSRVSSLNVKSELETLRISSESDADNKTLRANCTKQLNNLLAIYSDPNSVELFELYFELSRRARFALNRGVICYNRDDIRLPSTGVFAVFYEWRHMNKSDGPCFPYELRSCVASDHVGENVAVCYEQMDFTSEILTVVVEQVLKYVNGLAKAGVIGDIEKLFLGDAKVNNLIYVPSNADSRFNFLKGLHGLRFKKDDWTALYQHSARVKEFFGVETAILLKLLCQLTDTQAYEKWYGRQLDCLMANDFPLSEGDYTASAEFVLSKLIAAVSSRFDYITQKVYRVQLLYGKYSEQKKSLEDKFATLFGYSFERTVDGLKTTVNKSKENKIAPTFERLCNYIEQNLREKVEGCLEQGWITSLRNNQVAYELLGFEVLRRFRIHHGFVCALKKKSITPINLFSGLISLLENGDEFTAKNFQTINDAIGFIEESLINAKFGQSTSEQRAYREQVEAIRLLVMYCNNQYQPKIKVKNIDTKEMVENDPITKQDFNTVFEILERSLWPLYPFKSNADQQRLVSALLKRVTERFHGSRIRRIVDFKSNNLDELTHPITAKEICVGLRYQENYQNSIKAYLEKLRSLEKASNAAQVLYSSSLYVSIKYLHDEKLRTLASESVGSGVMQTQLSREKLKTHRLDCEEETLSHTNLTLLYGLVYSQDVVDENDIKKGRQIQSRIKDFHGMITLTYVRGYLAACAMIGRKKHPSFPILVWCWANREQQLAYARALFRNKVESRRRDDFVDGYNNLAGRHHVLSKYDHQFLQNCLAGYGSEKFYKEDYNKEVESEKGDQLTLQQHIDEILLAEINAKNYLVYDPDLFTNERLDIALTSTVFKYGSYEVKEALVKKAVKEFFEYSLNSLGVEYIMKNNDLRPFEQIFLGELMLRHNRSNILSKRQEEYRDSHGLVENVRDCDRLMQTATDCYHKLLQAKVSSLKQAVECDNKVEFDRCLTELRDLSPMVAQCFVVRPEVNASDDLLNSIDCFKPSVKPADRLPRQFYPFKSSNESFDADELSGANSKPFNPQYHQAVFIVVNMIDKIRYAQECSGTDDDLLMLVPTSSDVSPDTWQLVRDSEVKSPAYLLEAVCYGVERRHDLLDLLLQTFKFGLKPQDQIQPALRGLLEEIFISLPEGVTYEKNYEGHIGSMARRYYKQFLPCRALIDGFIRGQFMSVQEKVGVASDQSDKASDIDGSSQAKLEHVNGSQLALIKEQDKRSLSFQQICGIVDVKWNITEELLPVILSLFGIQSNIVDLGECPDLETYVNIKFGDLLKPYIASAPSDMKANSELLNRYVKLQYCTQLSKTFLSYQTITGIESVRKQHLLAMLADVIANELGRKCADQLRITSSEYKSVGAETQSQPQADGEVFARSQREALNGLIAYLTELKEELKREITITETVASASRGNGEVTNPTALSSGELETMGSLMTSIIKDPENTLTNIDRFSSLLKQLKLMVEFFVSENPLSNVEIKSPSRDSYAQASVFTSRFTAAPVSTVLPDRKSNFSTMRERVVSNPVQFHVIFNNNLWLLLTPKNAMVIANLFSRDAKQRVVDYLYHVVESQLAHHANIAVLTRLIKAFIKVVQGESDKVDQDLLSSFSEYNSKYSLFVSVLKPMFSGIAPQKRLLANFKPELTDKQLQASNERFLLPLLYALAIIKKDEEFSKEFIKPVVDEIFGHDVAERIYTRVQLFSGQTNFAIMTAQLTDNIEKYQFEKVLKLCEELNTDAHEKGFSYKDGNRFIEPVDDFIKDQLSTFMRLICNDIQVQNFKKLTVSHAEEFKHFLSLVVFESLRDDTRSYLLDQLRYLKNSVLMILQKLFSELSFTVSNWDQSNVNAFIIMQKMFNALFVHDGTWSTPEERCVARQRLDAMRVDAHLSVAEKALDQQLHTVPDVVKADDLAGCLNRASSAGDVKLSEMLEQAAEGNLKLHADFIASLSPNQMSLINFRRWLCFNIMMLCSEGEQNLALYNKISGNYFCLSDGDFNFGCVTDYQSNHYDHGDSDKAQLFFDIISKLNLFSSVPDAAAIHRLNKFIPDFPVLVDRVNNIQVNWSEGDISFSKNLILCFPVQKQGVKSLTRTAQKNAGSDSLNFVAANKLFNLNFGYYSELLNFVSEIAASESPLVYVQSVDEKRFDKKIKFTLSLSSMSHTKLLTSIMSIKTDDDLNQLFNCIWVLIARGDLQSATVLYLGIMSCVERCINATDDLHLGNNKSAQKIVDDTPEPLKKGFDFNGNDNVKMLVLLIEQMYQGKIDGKLYKDVFSRDRDNNDEMVSALQASQCAQQLFLIRELADFGYFEASRRLLHALKLHYPHEMLSEQFAMAGLRLSELLETLDRASQLPLSDAQSHALSNLGVWGNDTILSIITSVLENSFVILEFDDANLKPAERLNFAVEASKAIVASKEALGKAAGQIDDIVSDLFETEFQAHSGNMCLKQYLIEQDDELEKLIRQLSENNSALISGQNANLQCVKLLESINVIMLNKIFSWLQSDILNMLGDLIQDFSFKARNASTITQTAWMNELKRGVQDEGSESQQRYSYGQLFQFLKLDYFRYFFGVALAGIDTVIEKNGGSLYTLIRHLSKLHEKVVEFSLNLHESTTKELLDDLCESSFLGATDLSGLKQEISEFCQKTSANNNGDDRLNNHVTFLENCITMPSISTKTLSAIKSALEEVQVACNSDDSINEQWGSLKGDLNSLLSSIDRLKERCQLMPRPIHEKFQQVIDYLTSWNIMLPRYMSRGLVKIASNLPTMDSFVVTEQAAEAIANEWRNCRKVFEGFASDFNHAFALTRRTQRASASDEIFKGRNLTPDQLMREHNGVFALSVADDNQRFVQELLYSCSEKAASARVSFVVHIAKDLSGFIDWAVDSALTSQQFQDIMRLYFEVTRYYPVVEPYDADYQKYRTDNVEKATLDQLINKCDSSINKCINLDLNTAVTALKRSYKLYEFQKAVLKLSHDRIGVDVVFEDYRLSLLLFGLYASALSITFGLDGINSLGLDPSNTLPKIISKLKAQGDGSRSIEVYLVDGQSISVSIGGQIVDTFRAIVKDFLSCHKKMQHAFANLTTQQQQDNQDTFESFSDTIAVCQLIEVFVLLKQTSENESFFEQARLSLRRGVLQISGYLSQVQDPYQDNIFRLAAIVLLEHAPSIVSDAFLSHLHGMFTDAVEVSLRREFHLKTNDAVFVAVEKEVKARAGFAADLAVLADMAKLQVSPIIRIEDEANIVSLATGQDDKDVMPRLRILLGNITPDAIVNRCDELLLESQSLSSRLQDWFDKMSSYQDQLDMALSVPLDKLWRYELHRQTQFENSSRVNDDSVDSPVNVRHVKSQFNDDVELGQVEIDKINSLIQLIPAAAEYAQITYLILYMSAQQSNGKTLSQAKYGDFASYRVMRADLFGLVSGLTKQAAKNKSKLGTILDDFKDMLGRLKFICDELGRYQKLSELTVAPPFVVQEMKAIQDSVIRILSTQYGHTSIDGEVAFLEVIESAVEAMKIFVPAKLSISIQELERKFDQHDKLFKLKKSLFKAIPLTHVGTSNELMQMLLQYVLLVKNGFDFDFFCTAIRDGAVSDYVHLVEQALGKVEDVLLPLMSKPNAVYSISQSGEFVEIDLDRSLPCANTAGHGYTGMIYCQETFNARLTKLIQLFSNMQKLDQTEIFKVIFGIMDQSVSDLSFISLEAPIEKAELKDTFGEVVTHASQEMAKVKKFAEGRLLPCAKLMLEYRDETLAGIYTTQESVLQVLETLTQVIGQTILYSHAKFVANAIQYFSTSSFLKSYLSKKSNTTIKDICEVYANVGKQVEKKYLVTMQFKVTDASTNKAEIDYLLKQTFYPFVDKPSININEDSQADDVVLYTVSKVPAMLYPLFKDACSHLADGAVRFVELEQNQFTAAKHTEFKAEVFGLLMHRLYGHKNGLQGLMDRVYALITERDGRIRLSEALYVARQYFADAKNAADLIKRSRKREDAVFGVLNALAQNIDENSGKFLTYITDLEADIATITSGDVRTVAHTAFIVLQTWRSCKENNSEALREATKSKQTLEKKVAHLEANLPNEIVVRKHELETVLSDSGSYDVAGINYEDSDILALLDQVVDLSFYEGQCTQLTKQGITNPEYASPAIPQDCYPKISEPVTVERLQTKLNSDKSSVLSELIKTHQLQQTQIDSYIQHQLHERDKKRFQQELSVMKVMAEFGVHHKDSKIRAFSANGSAVVGQKFSSRVTSADQRKTNVSQARISLNEAFSEKDTVVVKARNGAEAGSHVAEVHEAYKALAAAQAALKEIGDVPLEIRSGADLEELDQSIQSRENACEKIQFELDKNAAWKVRCEQHIDEERGDSTHIDDIGVADEQLDDITPSTQIMILSNAITSLDKRLSENQKLLDQERFKKRYILCKRDYFVEAYIALGETSGSSEASGDDLNAKRKALSERLALIGKPYDIKLKRFFECAQQLSILPVTSSDKASELKKEIDKIIDEVSEKSNKYSIASFYKLYEKFSFSSAQLYENITQAFSNAPNKASSFWDGQGEMLMPLAAKKEAFGTDAEIALAHANPLGISPHLLGKLARYADATNAIEEASAALADLRGIADLGPDYVAVSVSKEGASGKEVVDDVVSEKVNETFSKDVTVKEALKLCDEHKLLSHQLADAEQNYAVANQVYADAKGVQKSAIEATTTLLQHLNVVQDFRASFPEFGHYKLSVLLETLLAKQKIGGLNNEAGDKRLTTDGLQQYYIPAVRHVLTVGDYLSRITQQAATLEELALKEELAEMIGESSSQDGVSPGGKIAETIASIASFESVDPKVKANKVVRANVQADLTRLKSKLKLYEQHKANILDELCELANVKTLGLVAKLRVSRFARLLQPLLTFDVTELNDQVMHDQEVFQRLQTVIAHCDDQLDKIADIPHQSKALELVQVFAKDQNKQLILQFNQVIASVEALIQVRHQVALLRKMKDDSMHPEVLSDCQREYVKLRYAQLEHEISEFERGGENIELVELRALQDCFDTEKLLKSVIQESKKTNNNQQTLAKLTERRQILANEYMQKERDNADRLTRLTCHLEPRTVALRACLGQVTRALSDLSAKVESFDAFDHYQNVIHCVNALPTDCCLMQLFQVQEKIKQAMTQISQVTKAGQKYEDAQQDFNEDDEKIILGLLAQIDALQSQAEAELPESRVFGRPLEMSRTVTLTVRNSQHNSAVAKSRTVKVGAVANGRTPPPRTPASSAFFHGHSGSPSSARGRSTNASPAKRRTPIVRRPVNSRTARTPGRSLDTSSMFSRVSTNTDSSGSLGDITEKRAAAADDNKLFYGLTFKAIARDNHCLFTAVGHHLQPKKTYQELRREVADLMSQNIENFMQFHDENEIDKAGFERYIEAIRSTTKWGGQCEIAALHQLYERTIVVISANNPPVIHGQATVAGAGDPIMLFHTGAHYDTFEANGDITTAEALVQMQMQIAADEAADERTGRPRGARSTVVFTPSEQSVLKFGL